MNHVVNVILSTALNNTDARRQRGCEEECTILVSNSSYLLYYNWYNLLAFVAKEPNHPMYIDMRKYSLYLNSLYYAPYSYNELGEREKKHI